jgi:hypothetical protein
MDAVHMAVLDCHVTSFLAMTDGRRAYGRAGLLRRSLALASRNDGEGDHSGKGMPAFFAASAIGSRVTRTGVGPVPSEETPG